MRRDKRDGIIGEAGHLANLRSFAGNAMRGVVTPSYAEQGQLPTADYVALSGAIVAGTVAYLVYSYATPIAWVLRKPGEPGGAPSDIVVSPDVRYSQTTSSHQASARAWLPGAAPAAGLPGATVSA